MSSDFASPKPTSRRPPTVRAIAALIELDGADDLLATSGYDPSS
jgi:hypothetical protein